MKKSAKNSELSWGAYKRLAEKYQANPGDSRFQELLEDEKSRYQKQYQELIAGVRAYMSKKCSLDKIADPRFKLWFQRQDARNKFQSSIIRHMEGLYYIPVAFELTDGCSVGCDFCCLAAKSLRSIYRYTPEHGREWQQILSATREILGDFAGAGICYFATEPFDNPDYEKFLGDFRDLLGYVPQTTTAAADRDTARTKAFLKMLGNEELSHAAVRFSIVSLEQLEKIHRAFPEEELYCVELLLNNPESGNCYSRSGRARQLSEEMAEKGFLDTASSICTNGFVINMARHTVMLMTARRPNERYPLGMKVLEKRSFDDAGGYQKALLELIEKWMPKDMPEDKPMRLADYITYEQSGYRLKIQGDKISRTVTVGETEQEGFRRLFEENMSVREILCSLDLTEYEKKRFLKNVKLFYESGYLEERREDDGVESGKNQ